MHTNTSHNVLCRFDPLWNSLVVAGMQEGEPFCALVTMIGVHYEDKYICTGFASQLGLPLIRDEHTANMSEADASTMLQQALKVRPQILSSA